jgi:hypothetical protein
MMIIVQLEVEKNFNFITHARAKAILGHV